VVQVAVVDGGRSVVSEGRPVGVGRDWVVEGGVVRVFVHLDVVGEAVFVVDGSREVVVAVVRGRRVLLRIVHVFEIGRAVLIGRFLWLWIAVVVRL